MDWSCLYVATVQILTDLGQPIAVEDKNSADFPGAKSTFHSDIECYLPGFVMA